MGDAPLLVFNCPRCKTPLPASSGLYFQCPMCGLRGKAPTAGNRAESTPDVIADPPSGGDDVDTVPTN